MQEKLLSFEESIPEFEEDTLEDDIDFLSLDD